MVIYTTLAFPATFDVLYDMQSQSGRRFGFVVPFIKVVERDVSTNSVSHSGNPSDNVTRDRQINQTKSYHIN